LARGLAALLESGVPLVEALRVVGPTMSTGIRDEVGRVSSQVEQGLPFYRSLAEGVSFERDFVQLVSVGEQAGDLPAVLRKIGERYERSSRRSVERLSALLEPASIVFLAFLVGTVAVAAILPLFHMQETFR